MYVAWAEYETTILSALFQNTFSPPNIGAAAATPAPMVLTLPHTIIYYHLVKRALFVIGACT